MEGIGPANYVWSDQPIGYVHLISGQETLQNAGRNPNRAYQPTVYAAPDESKDSLMQEMWC